MRNTRVDMVVQIVRSVTRCSSLCILVLGCVGQVELAVPPLSPEQPAVFRLEASPSELFAFTENNGLPLRTSWVRMSWDDGVFRPLEIDGCRSIVDLVVVATELAVLCQRDGQMSLARRGPAAIDWVFELLPIPADRFGATLAVSGRRVAIVTSNAIFWNAGDLGWQHVPFIGKTELEQGYPPSAALVAHDSLWLGYNAGEWGGSLYVARTDADGRLKEPDFIRDLNVDKILEASDGSVWVAGGLAHLSLWEAVILKASADEIRPVVDQRNWPRSGQPLRDPEAVPVPEDSSLEAFALDERENPISILGDRGIFTLRDREAELLVSADFSTKYPCEGAICVSSATDLVEGPDGALYVATTMVSVLRLRRSLFGYSVDQLLVPDSVFNEIDDPVQPPP